MMRRKSLISDRTSIRKSLISARTSPRSSPISAHLGSQQLLRVVDSLTQIRDPAVVKPASGKHAQQRERERQDLNISHALPECYHCRLVLLAGKIVLITGASRGIGAACAESFARRGALLSLAARSAISQPGTLCIRADLTLPEDREALVRRTLDHYGRIDILINNAGDGLYSPTEVADLDQARRMFELNLFAAVGVAQLVLPGMRAQASGTIVNVTSIAAAIPLPWMTLYSASKAALSAATQGLRRELRGSQIRIMEVQPGYVVTGFQDHATGHPPPGVLKLRKRAITAAQCGEAIARGVEREASRVVTPASGWFAIALERVLPSVIDSALGRMNQ